MLIHTWLYLCSNFLHFIYSSEIILRCLYAHISYIFLHQWFESLLATLSLINKSKTLNCLFVYLKAIFPGAAPICPQPSVRSVMMEVCKYLASRIYPPELVNWWGQTWHQTPGLPASGRSLVSSHLEISGPRGWSHSLRLSSVLTPSRYRKENLWPLLWPPGKNCGNPASSQCSDGGPPGYLASTPQLYWSGQARHTLIFSW